VVSHVCRQTVYTMNVVCTHCRSDSLFMDKCNLLVTNLFIKTCLLVLNEISEGEVSG
jgi:hypothetical protein